MGLMEKQEETYLSVCGQHDYDLLTGKKKMTQEGLIIQITMMMNR